MSAVPAAQNHWWSRSKPSPKHSKDKSPLHLNHSFPSLPQEFEKDRLADHAAKQSSKFNTLASVMGLKPKKHNISIQDPPPLPSQPPYTADPYISHYPSRPHSSRPHSNAVSSTTDDSSYEPKTPSDSYPKSIMTISDPDPFASSGIVPHNLDTEDDPNRLSVLSEASKRSFYSEYGIQYRQSYTSTSSNSHVPPRERLVSESSVSGLSNHYATNLTARALMVRTSSEGDSSFFKEATVKSSAIRPVSREKDSMPPRTTSEARRPMRPRGMTDLGPAPTLIRSHSSAMPRPLVLVRQPSFSRTLAPPPNNSPPPAQALPPVPFLDPSDISRSPAGTPPIPSSTSSSVSFASEFSEKEDMKLYTPLSTNYGSQRGQRVLKDPIWSQERVRSSSPQGSSNGTNSPMRTSSPPIDSHRFVKRVISNQTLGQTVSTPSSPTVVDHWNEGVHLASSSKAPKKQRSFHHPRMPIPPIPSLRHANSFTPSETSPDISREKDKERLREKEKRESAASLTRRRLFPSTMRRSSSNQTTSAGTDEDSASVFSLSPEADRYATSFINPFASPGSESMVHSPVSTPPPSDTPNHHTPTLAEQRRPSETHSIDYTPQQIMSPAEMLKIEAMMRGDMGESSDQVNITEWHSANHSGGSNGATLSEFGLRSASRRPRGNSFADSVRSGSTTFSAGAFTDRLDTSSSSMILDQHRPHSRGRTDSGGASTLERFSTRSRNGNALASPMVATATIRPSTSQGTMNYHFVDLTKDSDAGIVSLPAPPRHRPRQTVRVNTENIASAEPQPFHAVRRNKSSRPSTATPTATPTSYPELRAPPSAFNNTLPRRSIMKKPSFLDIEDEIEGDVPVGPATAIRNIRKVRSDDSLIDDSFLDLGRDRSSFDTVRSMSTESYS